MPEAVAAPPPLPQHGLTRAIASRSAAQQIREYAASARTSDLLLPPCFNEAERSQLHNLAVDLKLEHTTVSTAGLWLTLALAPAPAPSD